MAAIRRKTFAAAFSALFALGTALSPASAQSLIRDAEIEETIRIYSEPIFAAAGLVPENVETYIINDPTLNAFVAGGQRVFLHTGLITELDRPAQLIGVIAHETGHISGGHLSRTQEALAGATLPIIIGTLLGAAAIAAGSPDAGIAGIQLGQHVAQRSVLAYSRTQESAADQAAVKFLNATGQSSAGLLETFDRFSDQEVLAGRNQDPYVRSHPLSRERIGALENLVNNSPYTDRPDKPDHVTRYNMMKAKIIGFLGKPQTTFRIYPESDQSLHARYARALAYYRIPEIETALAAMDELVAEQPQNPYFHELRGQVLLEFGQPANAIPSYREAVKLAPHQPLLRVGLAQAIIATENPGTNKEAMDHLVKSLRDDPENFFAWHQLAIAYHRDGQVGMADYATAERHYRANNLGQAQVHAQRAIKVLPQGSPAWNRTLDIQQSIQQSQKKKRRS